MGELKKKLRWGTYTANLLSPLVYWLVEAILPHLSLIIHLSLAPIVQDGHIVGALEAVFGERSKIVVAGQQIGL